MNRIIFAFFFLTSTALAQNAIYREIITDPVLSRRCKELIKERKEKIDIKSKLNSLYLRNEILQKRTKPNQESVRQRLEINQTQIKNNLRLTTLKVNSMEENIIRKGCPGINI